MNSFFDSVKAKDRVAICGAPRSGKTTLADRLNRHTWHTDDLIDGRTWSEASEQASHWFDMPGVWCIEGVAVYRALRKWLVRWHAYPKRTPCDVLVVLPVPRICISPGQERMRKGCETVLAEIRPELERRGVEIVVERYPDPC